MKTPMRLPDDAIRAALTPPSDVHAPAGLADDIRLAITTVPQRSAGFAWRPSRRAWPLLRIALAVAFLLLLAAMLWVAGSRLVSAPPALVSTYHGGPARTGIMPGPAPRGEPVLEHEASMSGPFGGPNPVVAQGLVLTGDQRGNVTAMDLLTHDEVWQLPLGASINAGPSVAGDLVLVGDDAGILHALDLPTGQVRWTWQAAGPIQSSTAVVGDVAIVGSLGGELVALDVATGTPRWKVTTPGQVSRSVAAADGLVYAGVGGPADDGQLIAYDLATGAQRWSRPLQPGNTSTPTVAGGRVYVTGGLDAQTDDAHALYAFDAATGTPAWPAPWVSDTGQNLYIDAAADGLVVVGSSDGKLVALDAATGQVRWIRDDVGAALSPNGGVVGTVLYVAVGGNGLMAVDLATGTTIWTFPTKGDPSAPTIVDGWILIDTSVGKLDWIGGGGPTPSTAPGTS